MHLSRSAQIALFSAATYLSLALLAGGRLPLVEREMFRFAVMEGPVAIPLFRADGEIQDIQDFTDFSGLSPDDVDIQHRGFQSSVEQHFHEQRAWIAAHPAPPGALPGPVPVEVGLLLLQVVEGRVTVRYRVDAHGTARRRS